MALRGHQTHFPDWGVMRRWQAPLHTSGAGCVAGIDTDRAVCLKHAICVPVCALILGSRALTVSPLKRVITASSPPGSGLRSRWQAAGSVVLVGGWPPVSSSPGTSEGPLWLGFLGDFRGAWFGEGSETPDWGALVLRCPLELPPSGPVSTLSDLVCITHTNQKCRLPQGQGAGRGGAQCGNASGCLMLHFCPCSISCRPQVSVKALQALLAG